MDFFYKATKNMMDFHLVWTGFHNKSFVFVLRPLREIIRPLETSAWASSDRPVHPMFLILVFFSENNYFCFVLDTNILEDIV